MKLDADVHFIYTDLPWSLWAQSIAPETSLNAWPAKSCTARSLKWCTTASRPSVSSRPRHAREESCHRMATLGTGKGKVTVRFHLPVSSVFVRVFCWVGKKRSVAVLELCACLWGRGCRVHRPTHASTCTHALSCAHTRESRSVNFKWELWNWYGCGSLENKQVCMLL